MPRSNAIGFIIVALAAASLHLTCAVSSANVANGGGGPAAPTTCEKVRDEFVRLNMGTASEVPTTAIHGKFDILVC